MKAMTWEREMPVALVVILLGSVTPIACRCSKGSEQLPDSGTAAPTAASTALVDVPYADSRATWERPPDVPQPASWESVPDLTTIEGLWGSKDAEEGWAELSSKEKVEEQGDKWRYPYPWHLLLHTPGMDGTYDCGVHEHLEDAGINSWRVAWCEGVFLEPGRRHAKRLVLQWQPNAIAEFIRIELEGVEPVELDRN